MKYWFVLLCCVSLQGTIWAQNYHAIQGSSYAGVLGVFDNPAGIVTTKFSWDVNLFSTQLKYNTNGVEVLDYSLLSSPANSRWRFKSTDAARYANVNFNTHLLNARIALDRKRSIAFGANLRGYTNAKTSRFNYVDSIETVQEFFELNPGLSSTNAKATSSTWAELFATYAQTVYDDAAYRLNVGGTLKLMKGLSAGFVQLNSLGLTSAMVNGFPEPALNTTTAVYGYSSNYDRTYDSVSTGQNIRNMIKYAQGGISLDVGAEILIKTQEVRSFYDEDDYYNYDWKIGISLLDLGFNRYNYGRESRSVSTSKGAIPASVMDQKFNNIFENSGAFKAFNDSLATVATTRTLNAPFQILNPTRLLVNVDRPIYNHFYANASVSINLASIAGDKRLYVKETNLFMLTPRWETKKLGAYLPIQVNTNGQFWMGAAFKAGPLLLGFHNLGNIFSKKKMSNGGGYLALVIKAFDEKEAKRDRRLDCPR